MTEVYIVAGWFGSDEWIESVWSDKVKAEAEVVRLWKERRSDVIAPDDYKQGLCKFDVETHEVRS